MKKALFTTALLFANIFAALPSSATPVHIDSTAASKLNWQDFQLSKSTKTVLTAQQKLPFTLPFAGIESPIAAYRIPANQGALEIIVESPVVNKQIFVPNALILDGNFNVAAVYSSSEFKFYEERGLKTNRLSTEIHLTPTGNQDFLYLLIYTTRQDLDKTTMIPHPAKLYAKATGKQPPALNDIEVKHSLNGEISIEVNRSEGTRIIGLPTTIFNSNKTTSVGTQTKNIDNKVNTPVERETETYFKQAVENALKENDINRALNLVNEAEKLGLTSPRKIFLKKVSSNK